MHKEKWYLKTGFICFLFACWPMFITIPLGVILLKMQRKEKEKIASKYGKLDELDYIIASKKFVLNNENQKIIELEEKKLERQKEIHKEIQDLIGETYVAQYNFSDYEGLTSEDCKNKLSILRIEEASLIKEGNAVNIDNQLASNLSKKALNDAVKLILRASIVNATMYYSTYLLKILIPPETKFKNLLNR